MLFIPVSILYWREKGEIPPEAPMMATAVLRKAQGLDHYAQLQQAFSAALCSRKVLLNVKSKDSIASQHTPTAGQVG